MENEVIETKPKNMYIQICVTQLVCVIVILISLIVIKCFFNNNYGEIKNWCEENVLEQTKISAFSDEE